MSESLSRLYLNVPFEEKNQAKSLGARWDLDKRAWWIDSSANKEQFSRWLKSKPNAEQPIYQDLDEDWSEEDLEDMLALDEIYALFVPWTCWKCKQDTLAFHGAANEYSMCVTPWLYWPDILDNIDQARRRLNLPRFGCIKPRFSKTVGEK